MIEDTLQETRERMGKTITDLEKELKRVRTGRASLSLLDGIRVDYYGTQTPLNQMASLSVPESRLIVIQPWDVSAIKEIEKAILKSDLGLTPSNDGTFVRIPIPQLSEERRMDLAKLVKKFAEEGRIAIRNIRRDANDHLKKMQKNHDMSEDELSVVLDEIQEITDRHIKEIDQVMEHKEKEIIEV